MTIKWAQSSCSECIYLYLGMFLTTASIKVYLIANISSVTEESVHVFQSLSMGASASLFHWPLSPALSLLVRGFAHDALVWSSKVHLSSRRFKLTSLPKISHQTVLYNFQAAIMQPTSLASTG